MQSEILPWDHCDVCGQGIGQISGLRPGEYEEAVTVEAKTRDSGNLQRQ